MALEGGQVDQWAADLEVVAEVFQDPDFNAFLSHVDVPAADKLRAVETVLAEVGPMVRNMVNLLVARGAVDAIADTCASFMELLTGTWAVNGSGSPQRSPWTMPRWDGSPNS